LVQLHHLGDYVLCGGKGIADGAAATALTERTIKRVESAVFMTMFMSELQDKFSAKGRLNAVKELAKGSCRHRSARRGIRAIETLKTAKRSQHGVP